jgi:hypothetical protein
MHVVACSTHVFSDITNDLHICQIYAHAIELDALDITSKTLFSGKGLMSKVFQSTKNTR